MPVAARGILDGHSLRRAEGQEAQAGLESPAGVRGRDDLSRHGVRQAALDGRRVRRAAGQPGGRAVRLLGRLLEAEAKREEKSIKQKSARQGAVARTFCAAARQRFDNRTDVGYSVRGRRGHFREPKRPDHQLHLRPRTHLRDDLEPSPVPQVPLSFIGEDIK